MFLTELILFWCCSWLKILLEDPNKSNQNLLLRIRFSLNNELFYLFSNIYSIIYIKLTQIFTIIRNHNALLFHSYLFLRSKEFLNYIFFSPYELGEKIWFIGLKSMKLDQIKILWKSSLTKLKKRTLKFSQTKSIECVRNFNVPFMGKNWSIDVKIWVVLLLIFVWIINVWKCIFILESLY